MVHDPAGAEIGLRAAAAAALAGIALAGCSGSSGSSSGQAPPAHAGARLGPPVRLADCAEWRAADYPERLDTVRGIRSFAGGPVGSPAGKGGTLDDDKAYDLFERYCANGFARRFKLYKLYTRAAGFTR